MLCYAKMLWDLKGMTFDQLWDLEAKEAVTGIQTLESGYVSHLYEVVAQRRVVAYANVPSLDDLDRTAFGRLPMREHLIFEEVWALEDGHTHTDVAGYLKARRATLENQPRFLFSVLLSWDPTRRDLDHNWKSVLETLKTSPHGTMLGIYRVAGRQRLIVLVDVAEATDLDAIFSLPGIDGASVDEIMGLRDYILFADDVNKHFKNV